MVEVLRQLVEAEVLRYTLQGPGFRNRFECAQQQLAGVFLVIRPFVRHAQHRQVGGHTRHRLGDDVEVLRRLQGQSDSMLTRNPVAPHARCQHHRGGADFAFHAVVQHTHTDCAAVLHHDVADFGVLEDVRATLPCTFGIRHGGVDRVGLPVIGRPQPADHALVREQRVFGEHIRRCEELHLHTKGTAHGAGALEFLKTRRVQRHSHRTVLLESGGLAGFGFQRLEQLRRVLGEFRQCTRGAQLRHQASGVPGGAAGQLPALQQQHILDAEFCQVVDDRATDDAATDDDDVCAGWNDWHGGLPPVSRA